MPLIKIFGLDIGTECIVMMEGHHELDLC